MATALERRGGSSGRKERQAQLDAQFAGLEIDPEKPPKLPPELVYYILDLASYNPPPADSTEPRARQRRAFLRSASLVCQQWRSEAQKLLWQRVTIHTNDAARSFLLSAEKGHHTDRLEVWSNYRLGDETIDGKVIKQILEASTGARALYLDDIDELCPTTLFHPSLANLRTLDVESVNFTDFPGPHHLPRGLPRLDDLTFKPLLNDPPNLPLITALVESGVRSATLKLAGEPPRPSGNRRRRPQVSALPTAAPAPSSPIRTLAFLDIEFVDLLDAECLAPLLRKCVSVETLRYNLIEPKMFRYLGSQLLRLDITHPVSDKDDCDDLKNMLKAGFRSLQKLKQLGLECHPTMNPPAAERVAVEQECKARGIECIWKE